MKGKPSVKWKGKTLVKGNVNFSTSAKDGYQQKNLTTNKDRFTKLAREESDRFKGGPM